MCPSVLDMVRPMPWQTTTVCGPVPGTTQPRRGILSRLVVSRSSRSGRPLLSGVRPGFACGGW
jgi:hypothetical protein